jgi:hypothetical protein
MRDMAQPGYPDTGHLSLTTWSYRPAKPGALFAGLHVVIRRWFSPAETTHNVNGEFQ